MNLYRFSPIQNEAALKDAIAHIDAAGHELCRKVMGRHLPVTGNLAVFAHYDDEYEALITIQDAWTAQSSDRAAKYRRLSAPITSSAQASQLFTHLYIRKPDPYRAHVGDFDVRMARADYEVLKAQIEAGQGPKRARVFPRNDLDMIELFDPDYDVLVYLIPTKEGGGK